MIKDVLNKYMHRVYRADPYTNVVNGAIGATLDDVHAKTDDWLLQLNVDTATWALAIYEKEHGIVTDVKKPLDERRSVIKSKMRGTGKIGAIQIKIVADAWSNGDVEVTLSPSGGTVIIQFTNVYGIPSNIPDLQAAVREIVPAHLAIEYQYKYYTYGEMKETGLTYEQIAATGLTYEQILTGGLRNGNND
ncbi:DUF2313 domain-containing protein [Paenibacillus taichungensis]|uniref:putative phage tail protein n=1 Tax=Paenibacillus taichungensis TaxID=484184 RepID=UPI002DB86FA0|nr:putative phage tail protein [Paenibacillus taichungensis]MEC0107279.1 DUF2313 domain-containing protein [Paenibacillus taichungensis]MEC0194789.1 DUF2313 domain-containing protein [Paenibacillus taichungensis]